MGSKLDWPTVTAVVTAVSCLAFGWHAFWILPTAVTGICSFVLATQALQYFSMSRAARVRRLQILETDFGRHAGWFVELDERRVAVLLEPRFFDMFWDSYQIELLTEYPEEGRRILTNANWWGNGKLMFRNRVLDIIAENAFAGVDFPEKGRVIMRGLYLASADSNAWERWMQYFRAITAKRHTRT